MLQLNASFLRDRIDILSTLAFPISSTEVHAREMR
jgi:hypothetical protein